MFALLEAESVPNIEPAALHLQTVRPSSNEDAFWCFADNSVRSPGLRLFDHGTVGNSELRAVAPHTIRACLQQRFQCRAASDFGARISAQLPRRAFHLVGGRLSYRRV